MQVVSQPKIPNQMSFNERKADLDDQKKKEEEELERRKKSPFSDFYQVNRRHSNDMQWLLSESPKAFQILLFLLDHMDKYNAVMCSYTVFKNRNYYWADSRAKNSFQLCKNIKEVSVLIVNFSYNEHF